MDVLAIGTALVAGSGVEMEGGKAYRAEQPRVHVKKE